MDLTTRITSYLATEAQAEEYDRRKHEVDETTKFVYFKIREFYWTLTRLAGLAHWHDGSKRKRNAKDAPIARALMAGDGLKAMMRPRVLIDMTSTYRSGVETGIQRVVREVAKWAIESGDGLPVFIDDGRLVSYYRHPFIPEIVEICDGDKFLMLDAGEHHIEELAAIMREISARGGENIVGLHDVIPLLYPSAVSPGAFLAFQTWFETIALASDAIICVSQSSARSFVEYVAREEPASYSQQRIGWWRLGADFESGAHAGVSQLAFAIGAADTPFFLSVGTLEPRKGYSVALSAFERLWASGVDARYVIVGRSSWQSRALEKRIRGHEEHGRRLFWLDDADDATLRYLYERAHNLIFASFAEGFGLPLAEAAHHGLPAIASDIPIFREIAGDHARFFDVLDAASLAARIGEALVGEKPSGSAPVWTWRESTQALLGMIRADAYQWRPARLAPEAPGSRKAIVAPKKWRQDDGTNYFDTAS